MRRRVRDRERGASLVELALILPVFALLAFGTVDLARAYRLNIRLEAAAREGAGFAQVQPNDVVCSGDFDAGDYDDIIDFALAEDATLRDHPGFGVRVLDSAGDPLDETCRSEDSSLAAQVVSGERLAVEARADFEVLTPLVRNLVGSPLNMSSSAEVRAQ